jgi:hypothetical protein
VRLRNWHASQQQPSLTVVYPLCFGGGTEFTPPITLPSPAPLVPVCLTATGTN